MKYKGSLFRKYMALLLAILVGFSFMPLLTESVYAEGSGQGEADQTEAAAEGEYSDIGQETDDNGNQTEIPQAGSAEEDLLPEVVIDEEEEVPDPEIPVITEDQATVPEDAVVEQDPEDDSQVEISAGPSGAVADSGFEAAYAQASGNIKLSDIYEVKYSNNVLTGYVKSPFSSAPDYVRFGNIYWDNTLITTVNNTSFSINLSSYGRSASDVGYHTVTYYLYDYYYNQIYGTVTYIPRNITSAPSYKGVFEVYSKYFYYSPYNMSSDNKAYDLYMDYSSNGGKTWSTTGYMRANMIKLYTDQSYTIGGLKSNKKYKTRIYYGKWVSYNGKSYFFKGPAFNTGTIKTGKSKKPKIKSVTAKAVKVKYHKVKHAGYWNIVGGTAFWHDPYTEKFYTYKVKVTVRLKKKPGTKGIWINGKFCKGNKKKYTKTFSVYPNYSAKHPRGHVKYQVAVCSYQSKSYGGYSPLYKKTKKLK